MGILSRWRERLGLGPRRYPIAPAPWHRLLNSWPLFAGFEAAERERLRDLAERFLGEKQILGMDGFVIEPEVNLEIGAIAALLVLHLDLALYRGWRSILIYPATFVAPQREMDDAGVVHEWEEARSGEAWPDGAVILAWADVQAGRAAQDGFNPLLHELAHKLDMANGFADGFPPLPKGMDPGAWQQVMQAAFDRVCAIEDGDPDDWIDPYAAEGPDEFFAVMSEYFFETPQPLRRAYPDLYAQFARFYGQDPALRQDTQPEP